MTKGDIIVCKKDFGVVFLCGGRYTIVGYKIYVPFVYQNGDGIFCYPVENTASTILTLSEDDIKEYFYTLTELRRIKLKKLYETRPTQS